MPLPRRRIRSYFVFHSNTLQIRNFIKDLGKIDNPLYAHIEFLGSKEKMELIEKYVNGKIDNLDLGSNYLNIIFRKLRKLKEKGLLRGMTLSGHLLRRISEIKSTYGTFALLLSRAMEKFIKNREYIDDAMLSLFSFAYHIRIRDVDYYPVLRKLLDLIGEEEHILFRGIMHRPLFLKYFFKEDVEFKDIGFYVEPFIVKIVRKVNEGKELEDIEVRRFFLSNFIEPALRKIFERYGLQQAHPLVTIFANTIYSSIEEGNLHHWESWARMGKGDSEIFEELASDFCFPHWKKQHDALRKSNGNAISIEKLLMETLSKNGYSAPVRKYIEHLFSHNRKKYELLFGKLDPDEAMKKLKP